MHRIDDSVDLARDYAGVHGRNRPDRRQIDADVTLLRGCRVDRYRSTESLFPAFGRGSLRLVIVVAEREVEHEDEHDAHDDPHPRAPLRLLWRGRCVVIRPGSTRVSLPI